MKHALLNIRRLPLFQSIMDFFRYYFIAGYS